MVSTQCKSRSLPRSIICVVCSLMACSVQTSWTQNVTRQVTISISTKDAVPISPLLYGINYDWDKIPAGEFPAFSAAMAAVAHVSMVRFPSGWNAEVYNWDTNIVTGKRAPAQPGATPDAVFAAFPTRTTITPTAKGIDDPDGIPFDVKQSVRLVKRYGAQIHYWEIGNEWWLMSGAKNDPVIREHHLHAYAALLNAVVPAMKKVNPSIVIFAGGQWTVPSDFSMLRRLVNPAVWRQIDGIYVHPYCGTADPETLCSLLPQVLAADQAASGKRMIYASEWAVVRKASTNDFGIRNAVYTIDALRNLALAGVQLGAYWPPARVLPALAFASADFQTPFPTGIVFGWMSKWYEGQALRTTGDPLAAAAQNGSEITVFVPSEEAGPETVRVSLAGTGMHRILSAEVLYSEDPDSPHGASEAHVVTLPATIHKGENGSTYVQFDLNPGTLGRGKAFEMARITLR